MKRLSTIVLALFLAVPVFAGRPDPKPFIEKIHPPVSYMRGDLKVDIVSIEEIAGGISVYARAFKAGKQLGLGLGGETDLEHFVFYNIDPDVLDPSSVVGTDEDGRPIHGKKSDPETALSEAILDAVRITGKEGANVKIGSVGRTTSTFYPDPSPETTTVDGYVRETNVESTFTTLRGAAGDLAPASGVSEDVPLLDSNGISNRWDQIRRGIFGFDTSPLGDSDTVDSATFSVYVSAKSDVFDQALVLDRRIPASATDLTSSDYARSGWDEVEQSGVRRDVTNITTGAYTDFSLNLTGKGNISKTGPSWFGLRFSSDFDGPAPTWVASSTASVTIQMAETSGTTKDPKLVVVHSAPPWPSVSINDVIVTEGNSGVAQATFTVTLSAAPTQAGSVQAATADGTATAPGDYTALSLTTIDFPIGVTSQAVTVDVVGDNGVEPNETFYVNLSTPVNLTMGDNQGIGTITNDDTAGIVVNPTTGQFTTEGGSTAPFTIVLTSQPSASVSIGLSSSDPTEGAVAPASVTFDGSNWNAPQTVTVTGVDDADADGDVAYGIVTAAATSSDSNYSGRAVADVSLLNVDDETSQGGGQILLTPPPPPYENSGILMRTTSTHPDISAKLGWADGAFGVYSSTDQPLFRVQSDGKVGIGTTEPEKTLHVVGDAFVSGTLSGGNIEAQYQDLAEWVPSAEDLSPGTVVVVDRARGNGVVASSTSFDTAVAGVISARPGILLGEEGTRKEAVATTGRVRVKVDATAPIAIGDLLVTSDRSGVAMKSVPLVVDGVPFHRPGTIIGKALEALDRGEGEILVLLSLQ